MFSCISSAADFVLSMARELYGAGFTENAHGGETPLIRFKELADNEELQ